MPRHPSQVLTRDQLRRQQLTALNTLLARILPANRFYREKLSGIKLPLASLDQLASLPLTTKEEFVAAAEVDPPANLTYPLANYSRLHQTSGTRGQPLCVYDTEDDWQWWIETWQFVLDSALVEADDRALMAFSFGPFIGFWSAYDALVARGCMVVPTGGMSTLQRLRMLTTCGATVVCCTPTYAMRMAEVAAEHQIELPACGVKSMIVAGEPGGSITSVRKRIEDAWGTRVVDHAGATEVGPWGFADDARTGLHVAESHFIAEFLPVAGTPLQELVLTALGRAGWPVLRYRTGDLVKPLHATSSPGRFVLLEGGVLGRADEMLVVRGVNIYSAAIDTIVQACDEVGEYRTVVYRDGELDGLRVEIEVPEIEVPGETDADPASRLAESFQTRLGLRVDVEIVACGVLPRFEAKSRRLFDERT